MDRRNVITVGVLACLIVATPPLRAQSQEKESEHMAEAQQVIRVAANRLVPESISIKAGEVVSWINYSGVPLQISFGAETVEKIRCKEPTRFHIARDGSLTSGEVRPFEVAALCSFLPGEYHYIVYRQVSTGLAKSVTRDSSGHIAVTQ
jgi:plastocyanin